MAAKKGTQPPNAGKGRGKGNKNLMTRELKDMIRGALDDAGGQAYLAKQAIEQPAAFMTLLGKILPKDVNVGGQDGNPIRSINKIELVSLASDSTDSPAS